MPKPVFLSKITPLPRTATFKTLKAAYDATSTVLGHHTVRASAMYEDLYEHARPPDETFALLGVESRADKLCKQLDPTGEWKIEMDVLEHGVVRFQAWYSSFLPYAVAMVESENVEHDIAECWGIRYDSINAYYGTVMGFVTLGQGDGHNPETGYWRIRKEDSDLFDECYMGSIDVTSPQLPFDEAYRPCLVYVALTKPSIIAQHYNFDHNHRNVQHIYEVCDKMNRPRPRFRWPRIATPA
jgi:hypothetical protein